MNHRAQQVESLPCVVQLGFAGSRNLWGDDAGSPERVSELDAAAQEYLKKRLENLRGDLGLKQNHFLVAISQLACGGDTFFTKACGSLGIHQRIFLPQHRAEFLDAKDSDGAPDFTPAQRAEAELLFESPHIIQERVVSHSADRTERFAETNAEILRVSDVVVCLRRVDAVGRTGGTTELLERAVHRGIPALEIQACLENGEPKFKPLWHPADAPRRFDPLPLPVALSQVSFPAATMLPTIEEYCKPLSDLASRGAAKHQWRFRFAAALIIATHILATIFATLALEFHHHEEVFSHGLVMCLLAVELLLLVCGYGMHQYLHRTHAARMWATQRVVAELIRSIRAIYPRHIYLEHFFRLQLPYRFRGLVRTLNVLYLRSTREHRKDPWQSQRDVYLRRRIDDEKSGQIAFYTRRLAEDERRLSWCQWTFMGCSLAAMGATATKLVFLGNLQRPAVGCEEFLLASLGTLAIVLPVLAVAGLSWAAALDCAARVETFGETLAFLLRERPLIERATSGAEADRLLVETETVLLGETAAWYARRANTGVA